MMAAAAEKRLMKTTLHAVRMGSAFQCVGRWVDGCVVGYMIIRKLRSDKFYSYLSAGKGGRECNADNMGVHPRGCVKRKNQLNCK